MTLRLDAWLLEGSDGTNPDNGEDKCSACHYYRDDVELETTPEWGLVALCGNCSDARHPTPEDDQC